MSESISDKELKNTYNELIEQVELDKIYLHTGKSYFLEEFPQIEEDEYDYDIEKDAEYRSIQGGFLAKQRYTMNLRVEGKEKEVAHIEYSVIVKYLSEKEMTDELFKLFKKNNLPLNTWPYFREYVQSAIAKMGLSTIAISFFKVPPR